MAKAGKLTTLKTILNHNPRKKTSIGDGNAKLSSMNKHKKSSYKAYRGQGR
jgi:hypothetical protein